MKIYIGADHQGEKIAKEIKEELSKMGYQTEYSKIENNETDDYPDFAFDVCENVVKEKENIGILLCGNGIGISIAANKVKGIRCARVYNVEDAHHAKNHNGANVIAFGGIPKEKALEIIKVFINTPNPTEERHIRRIEKIIQYERCA